MMVTTAKAPTPAPIPAIAPVDSSLVDPCWPPDEDCDDVAVANAAPEVLASDGADVGVDVGVFTRQC
jgi:hypothetical protein